MTSSRLLLSERLSSYGTLRQAGVQLELFGREVATTPDLLPEYVLGEVTISNPEVIATSGSDRHPILRKGRASDAVQGVFLDITEQELAVADKYEVEEYARVRVTLASGLDAWAYVAADEL